LDAAVFYVYIYTHTQVGLKYAGTRLLRCDEVVYEDATSDDTTNTSKQPAIKELKCSLVDMTDVSVTIF
jgi:hypothetical protein